jgi:cell division protein FtsL
MSSTSSYITGVLINKALSANNKWVLLGTVPAGANFATIGINVVNLSSTDVSTFTLAISSNSVPATSDFIESNVSIGPGGILERNQIIANVGENIFILGSSANLACRVYGVIQQAWTQTPTMIAQDMQTNEYTYAPDVSTVANIIDVTYSPVPKIQDGLGLSFRAANSNTDSITIVVNENSYPVLDVTGPIVAGAVVVGFIYDVIYNSGSFYLSGAGGITAMNNQNMMMLQNGIMSLDSEVATLNSEVATNIVNIAALSGEIGALSTTTNIATLCSEVATNTTNIETLSSDISNLATSGNITNLINISNENTTNINTLSGDVVTINAELSSWPYDIGGGFGGLSTPSQTILQYVAAHPLKFPNGNLSVLGYGYAGTAFTASTVYTIEVNGTVVGTIVFAAGAATPTFSPSGFSMTSGQVLKVVGPSTADATGANVSITLSGEIT